MRYLSVCSGMEAASVAWHPLGWTPVGFSEIEPFPCAILKHRFPNIPNYGSLTEYQSWPLEPGAIDLLVGGCPCQSFSVAGLRRGMQDPRGNLTLTYLGLADKLKPKWIVYENVPGLLSSNGGRDFGSFLGALVELGYGFAYRVLDAQHFGVPQRRRRVFVVACLGDWRAAAEVLSLREGLRGYLETGNKKRKGAAADAGASVEASGEGVATPFRKSKRAASTTDNETCVPADASNTLNNFDLGDTRTTHAVVQPVAWTQNQREEVRLLGDKVGAIALPGTHQTNYIAEPVHQMPGSVAPTIGASGPPYSRTGNERVEAEATAVTFQPGNLRREAGADPSFTTTTTLKASAGDQTPHIATPMAVRRLTPNECYRLQGFPDNWGNIPWKGKPEGQAPDGPQYKAAGNSMAVPVMRWIGERIAAVDSTHPSHA
jgi:DNA (cytosine-5)-methyltransferase 1